MPWKIGDRLILVDAADWENVFRAEGYITYSHPDTFEKRQGVLYHIKVYNSGTFRAFEPFKAGGSLRIFDSSWKLDLNTSQLRRCCNLCFKYLVDADHADQVSGSKFYCCSNLDCTVGVWKQANGTWPSLPATQEVRNARKEFFELLKGMKHTAVGIRVAERLIRVNRSVGHLNLNECMQLSRELVVAAERELPGPMMNARDAQILANAAIVAASKARTLKPLPKKPEQPSAPFVNPGRRTLDLD